MRVDLHTDARAFQSLREEWDDLLPRSLGDTLFQRPAWLAAWWQVFGTEGSLRLITVRDEQGRLAGVAPFFLADISADPSEPVPNLSYERPVPNPAATVHRTLLFVGGTEVSDYLDLVVEPAAAPAVHEAVWHAIVHEIEGWEWIDLHCLPAGSPTAGRLGSLAGAAGLSVAVAQEDVCPVIALPPSWHEYLGLLNRKDRHELRRKMRRAELSGQMQLAEANDPAALDGQVATFMALHEASTPDKADFMRDPRMRRFFHLVAGMALENGWLNLSFLSLDGLPAASMFCFRYRDSVLVYNSGFEPRAWSSLSPGVVLLGHQIKQAIEGGRREFDFLQGDERYKYDLGAQDRPIQRLFVRR